MVEDRITVVDHLLVTVCQRTIDSLAIESGGKPDVEPFRLGVKPCIQRRQAVPFAISLVSAPHEFYPWKVVDREGSLPLYCIPALVRLRRMGIRDIVAFMVVNIEIYPIEGGDANGPIPPEGGMLRN